jgi:uncharacterized membrane protein YphA (DoxX/SURF4 family)
VDTVLLRPIARPLFASWFVAEGVDALRHPAVHTRAAREGVAALRGYVGRVPVVTEAIDRTLTSVSEQQLGLAVRAHAVATLAAAGALAAGKAPRTAGLALAVLTVPVVVASLPAARVHDDAESARRRRFFSSVSALGGAMLAAADLEGRPSIAWRVRAAREAKAAADDD